MLRNLLVGVSLLMLGHLSWSQVRLGGYVGTNDFRFTTKPVDSTRLEREFGMIIGLQAEFDISKDILLSIEPGYAFERSQLKVLKGQITPFTVGANTQDFRPVFVDSAEVRFNVWTIPVMAKVLSNNKQWNFVGGVAFEFPSDFKLVTKSETVNVSPGFKTLSLSGILGIGYRLNIKNSAFSIGVRYSQSITRLTEFDEGLGYFNGLKTANIRFILSWRINILNRLTE